MFCQISSADSISVTSSKNKSRYFSPSFYYTSSTTLWCSPKELCASTLFFTLIQTTVTENLILTRFNLRVRYLDQFNSFVHSNSTRNAFAISLIFWYDSFFSSPASPDRSNFYVPLGKMRLDEQRRARDLNCSLYPQADLLRNLQAFE